MSTQSTEWQIPEWSRGDRFRKAREARDISQGELAEAMGVARRTVGSYERDEVEPRKIVVNAWALATGVPVEWLLHGVDPTGPSGDGVPHGTSGPQGLNGTRNAHVVALSAVRDLAA